MIFFLPRPGRKKGKGRQPRERRGDYNKCGIHPGDRTSRCGINEGKMGANWRIPPFSLLSSDRRPGAEPDCDRRDRTEKRSGGSTPPSFPLLGPTDRRLGKTLRRKREKGECGARTVAAEVLLTWDDKPPPPPPPPPSSNTRGGGGWAIFLYLLLPTCIRGYAEGEGGGACPNFLTFILFSPFLCRRWRLKRRRGLPLCLLPLLPLRRRSAAARN